MTRKDFLAIIGPVVGLPANAGYVVTWRFEQRNEKGHVKRAYYLKFDAGTRCFTASGHRRRSKRHKRVRVKLATNIVEHLRGRLPAKAIAHCMRQVIIFDPENIPF